MRGLGGGWGVNGQKFTFKSRYINASRNIEDDCVPPHQGDRLCAGTPPHPPPITWDSHTRLIRVRIFSMILDTYDFSRLLKKNRLNLFLMILRLSLLIDVIIVNTIEYKGAEDDVSQSR